jgi:hypothetical protein
LLAALIALPALGQAIQLTPEQQMMLNQLPPAQREQALQVLRQQSAGAQSVGQPVRETVDMPSTAVSPRLAAEPIVEIPRAGANSRLVINFKPKQSLSQQELRDTREDPTMECCGYPASSPFLCSDSQNPILSAGSVPKRR